MENGSTARRLGCAGMRLDVVIDPFNQASRRRSAPARPNQSINGPKSSVGNPNSLFQPAGKVNKGEGK